jgi:hypothetical protein
MFFLKLTGFIPGNKQLEFEQTYRYIADQIPTACSRYSISKDALNEGVYHFISYWNSLPQLQTFSQSLCYLILIGAFNTLGELRENTKAELVLTEN